MPQVGKHSVYPDVACILGRELLIDGSGNRDIGVLRYVMIFSGSVL